MTDEQKFFETFGGVEEFVEPPRDYESELTLCFAIRESGGKLNWIPRFDDVSKDYVPEYSPIIGIGECPRELWNKLEKKERGEDDFCFVLDPYYMIRWLQSRLRADR